MDNVLFSTDYEVLTGFLIEMRTRSGRSQRALSRRLGRSQSHIHKLETRQRRVEIIEFCRLVAALGEDRSLAFSHLLDRLQASPGSRAVGDAEACT